MLSSGFSQASHLSSVLFAISQHASQITSVKDGLLTDVTSFSQHGHLQSIKKAES